MAGYFGVDPRLNRAPGLPRGPAIQSAISGRGPGLRRGVWENERTAALIHAVVETAGVVG